MADRVPSLSTREGVGTSGVPSVIAIRWTTATTVFAGAILWLTSVYTAPDASAASGWRSLLVVFNGGYHYTAAILLSAALILAVSANLSSILGVLSNQIGYAWLPWLTLHGLALLAFAFLTSLEVRDHLECLGPVARLACAVDSDRFVDARLLAFRVGAPVVLAESAASAVDQIGVGGCCRYSGLAGRSAGPESLEAACRGDASIEWPTAFPCLPGVSYDPTVGRLGTSTFTVEIFPACSGYEGISLAIVFVASLSLAVPKRPELSQGFSAVSHRDPERLARQCAAGDGARGSGHVHLPPGRGPRLPLPGRLDRLHAGYPRVDRDLTPLVVATARGATTHCRRRRSGPRFRYWRPCLP